MLQEIIFETLNSVKKKLPKIIVIGGLTLATAGALGYDYSGDPNAVSKQVSQQQTQQQEEKAYREKIRKLPKEQIERYELWGEVVETDTDDNTDLRFVIETGLTVEAYMFDRRFERLANDMKKYLVLVERKFDPKFAGEIEAIRKDINSRPYRVKIWTDADWKMSGENKIEGKYDAKVNLAGLFVYDNNPRIGSNEPDRAYPLIGVIGGVYGGVGGNPIKK
jgi:hypothetical protein